MVCVPVKVNEIDIRDIETTRRNEEAITELLSD